MEIKICVVGLGYVGLPLALALSKHFEVVGFDINKEKIELLKRGVDLGREISKEEINASSMEITSGVAVIKECNFIIACVPTPLDKNKRPDLSYLENVSKLIGENLSKGSIVVYESTVYPGVTEEICVPILERYSGLKCGDDFKVGYSPERMNPGDKEHTVNKIMKVVSGNDQESLETINSVYSRITKTHRASSIKVAEAAKVIENIQRDLNIALMNELAIIFDKIGIDTKAVLEAAETKWNFHKYYPGLVGGHCIGVDPYYLTYKAEELGYHPEVILAGRRINDDMHKFYAEKIIKKLIKQGKKIFGVKVLVMGLTFKPNVNDFRNSRVKHLIDELREYGIDVLCCDPLLENEIVEQEFGTKNYNLEEVKDVDLFVLAVNHDIFKQHRIPDELLFKIGF